MLALENIFSQNKSINLGFKPNKDLVQLIFNNLSMYAFFVCIIIFLIYLLNNLFKKMFSIIDMHLYLLFE